MQPGFPAIIVSLYRPLALLGKAFNYLTIIQRPDCVVRLTERSPIVG